MKTSEFDYELPDELIAQEPPAERGTSRIMVVHRSTGEIEHKRISDLPEYFNQGDLLIVNNTKVFPARIFGYRKDTGGKVELLLVQEVEGTSSGAHVTCWDCFLKARSRPKAGAVLDLGNGRIRGKVLDVRGQRITVQLTTVCPLFEVLEEEGFLPVPPYIKRDYGLRNTDGNVQDSGKWVDLVNLDRERYQTVYSERRGSIAAPTAGLHFTEQLLGKLASKGVERARITLHVGPGTFKPVAVDVVEEHNMEEEWYEVSNETADNINRTKRSGGRVIAVGSTSVRTLETVAESEGMVRAGTGRTSLFIYPKYEFKTVDVMLTNFHLPRSSLLMMVSALAGKDLVFRAYNEAIREKYRFYSYGDCMLIL